MKIAKVWRCLSICALCAFAAQLTEAETLDYGRYAGFGLGKGILGNDYGNPLASCVAGTQTTLKASQGDVRVSLVTNRDEFSKAMHFDASASASFLGIGGANAETHTFEENAQVNSRLAIIVEAYKVRDSQSLDNVRLIEPWLQLAKSGDPASVAKVRNACGDKYIQTVFNEARLFLVMDVNSSQSTKLRSARTSGGGNIGISLFSASASVGGDEAVRSANQSGQISLRIYSQGIEGITVSTELLNINKDDGLVSAANKLAAYLAGLKLTDQPVKYLLTPYPDMPATTLSSDRLVGRLSELKARYESNTARTANVASLLSSGDRRKVVLNEPAATSSLRAQQRVLDLEAEQVAAAHATCTKAASIQDCDAAMASLRPPPAYAPVELAAVKPTVVYAPSMFIDGLSVPPGVFNTILGSQKATLLEAARSVSPNAKNVDFAIPIFDPYLSLISFPVYIPTVNAGWGVVDTMRFSEGLLTLPPYWKTELPTSHVLVLVHADDASPCPLKQMQLGLLGDQIVADTCLSSGGKALQATIRKQAGVLIQAGRLVGDNSFSMAAENCFGEATPVMLGYHTLLMRPAENDAVSVIGALRIGQWIGAPIYIDEKRSRDTWVAYAQQPLPTVPQSSGGKPYGCSRHIS